MKRKNIEKLQRQHSFWELFRRFKHYFRPHKKRIVFIVFCLVVASLLNVFTIVTFKPIVEVFFGVEDDTAVVTAVPSIKEEARNQGEEPEPRGKFLDEMAENYHVAKWVKAGYDSIKQKKDAFRSWFVEEVRGGNKYSVLAILSLVVVMANFLRLIFEFTSSYFSSYVGLSIIRDIKADLYKHVLDLDMPFFSSRTTGHLMSRISSDVSGIRHAIMLLFSKVVEAPFNLFFYFAFIFYLNFKLTLCILIFVPITIVPIRYFGRRIKKLTRKERQKVADISAAMQEILSGIQIVKAFRMEDYEYKKFHKQNQQHFIYLLKRSRTKAMASPSMDFLGIAAVVVVLLLGGYFIMQKQTMNSPEFVIYIYALSRIYGPVKKIEKANEDVQEGLAHAERIFDLIDTKPTVAEPADALTLPPVKGNIEFENVSFGYNDEVNVLSDINLKIPAGKRVALVGLSGAGKSTLVSLIPRFYDPVTGRVTIDAIDIRRVTFDSLRGQIGIVSQESILFNDTIRNNIAYGRPDIPDDRIIQAAKMANAHGFITKLPDGYETFIGERGARLSGGERQRMTIARAILKDPPILVLDEATSNLDSESETLIQEALNRLILNRTTVVIAHRLSTVMNADMIVVLERGRIVETGVHDDLILQNGRYARLCQLQFNLDQV